MIQELVNNLMETRKSRKDKPIAKLVDYVNKLEKKKDTTEQLKQSKLLIKNLKIKNQELEKIKETYNILKTQSNKMHERYNTLQEKNIELEKIKDKYIHLMATLRN